MSAPAYIVLGIRRESWGLMACMMVRCWVEIVGYAALLVLYTNPFSFPGFLIQISFITTGPDVCYRNNIYPH